MKRIAERLLMITRRRLAALAVIFLGVALVSGCGYQFAGGGENIDKSIRTVYVDNFLNGTTEANIENTFRAAFIDWFIRGDRFKLAKTPEQADAFFRGNIKNLLTSPLSYTAGNVALENRLTVMLELTFEERTTKKILWSYKDFTGTGDYIADPANLSVSEIRRKTALIKLANDSAERAYGLMMSGF